MKTQSPTRHAADRMFANLGKPPKNFDKRDDAAVGVREEGQHSLSRTVGAIRLNSPFQNDAFAKMRHQITVRRINHINSRMALLTAALNRRLNRKDYNSFETLSLQARIRELTDEVKTLNRLVS